MRSAATREWVGCGGRKEAAGHPRPLVRCLLSGQALLNRQVERLVASADGGPAGQDERPDPTPQGVGWVGFLKGKVAEVVVPTRPARVAGQLM